MMETTLETTALILRPWRDDDLDALVEGLSDIRVAQWLAFVPHPYTRADALRWIEHCHQPSPAGDAARNYEFAIERKTDRAMIGGVSLNNVDMNSRSGGGGIWINAAHHRRGHGREAFGERIRFAFEDLGLDALHNGYFRGNAPSWDLQERFGYRHTDEAPRPRRCLADGLTKDEIMTSLRREDWVR